MSRKAARKVTVHAPVETMWPQSIAGRRRSLAGPLPGWWNQGARSVRMAPRSPDWLHKFRQDTTEITGMQESD